MTTNHQVNRWKGGISTSPLCSALEFLSSPKYFLYCQAILKPSSCTVTLHIQLSKETCSQQTISAKHNSSTRQTYACSSIASCSATHRSLPGILLWGRHRSRQCAKERAGLLHGCREEQGLLVHDALRHEGPEQEEVVRRVGVLHDHHDRAEEEAAAQNPCDRNASKSRRPDEHQPSHLIGQCT